MAGNATSSNPASTATVEANSATARMVSFGTERPKTTSAVAAPNAVTIAGPVGKSHVQEA
jgi:hypothetical protein